MYRLVSVDARCDPWAAASRDHLIVASRRTSAGRYPMFLPGDWATRAEEPVDAAALGGLVREAFKWCLVGVPMPDLRDDPDGRARWERVLRLGKARSERAYARITRHVSVLWDDEKRTIKLDSSQSDYRGGFEGIRGSEIVVKDKVTDAELGSAVRQAIAAAKSLAG